MIRTTNLYDHHRQGVKLTRVVFVDVQLVVNDLPRVLAKIRLLEEMLHSVVISWMQSMCVEVEVYRDIVPVKHGQRAVATRRHPRPKV